MVPPGFPWIPPGVNGNTHAAVARYIANDVRLPASIGFHLTATCRRCSRSFDVYRLGRAIDAVNTFGLKIVRVRKSGVPSRHETSPSQVIYNRLGDCFDRCIGRESPLVLRIVLEPTALIEARHRYDCLLVFPKDTKTGSLFRQG